MTQLVRAGCGTFFVVGTPEESVEVNGNTKIRRGEKIFPPLFVPRRSKKRFSSRPPLNGKGIPEGSFCRNLVF